MTILGIETSCDETSAALVENGTKLLSLVTATSQEMHQKYGGIIPDRAARAQLKSILPVIHESLQPLSSNLKPQNPTSSFQRLASKVDALAVTVGPGLIGSLLIGVETAKSLALAWNKPLIPVNHLVGHIYANWLQTDQQPATSHQQPDFPALVLIVSGGHTDLVLMKDHGKLELLGTTLDDAAGECFDKCGRLLGLPYPYGPYIEQEASKFTVNGSQFTVKLPRPLINSKDFNFSFSGLKTAFLNEYNKLSTVNRELRTVNLAHELQEAVTDVLVAKVLKAVKEFHPKSILLAGGVAANLRLRNKMKLKIKNCELKILLYVPPLKLCTDNAAVIASAAFFQPNHRSVSKIQANPSLTITSV